MPFVNERISQEDRDKFFSKYEILERYYPRDWTIDRDRDRERESFLFLHFREREDMYLDELENKYGQYLSQRDIFLFNKCFVDVEIILPKYDFNYKNTDKFFVTKIRILNEEIFNKNLFIDLFSEAMNINRGFGIYLGDNAYKRKFEIDSSEMELWNNI